MTTPSSASSYPAPGSGVEAAESTIRKLLQTSGIPLLKVLNLVEEESQARRDADPVLNDLPAVAWGISKMGGELSKPTIEIRSGPSFSTEEISEVLDVSAQTIRDRADAGELIYYLTPGGAGRRFPQWQILNNDLVQPWIPKIIEAYGGNGWALIDFLTVPRTTLDGLNYLAQIQQGASGITEVIAAAKRSNRE